jgi:tetratricopeptide (TPR) repeat protein
MCYVHLGKAKEAIKWFSVSASSARENYAWDQFAARKSNSFVKAGSVDEFEIMWHDAERLRRARRFSDGIDLLNAKKKFLDPNSDAYKNKVVARMLPDYIGHWNWMMGRYLKGLKAADRLAEAERVLTMATRTKPTKEKYIVPYAYYDLADMALNQGNLQAAKSYVNEARKFDPKEYDFGSVLIRQLDLVEDRIKGIDLVSLIHGPL